MAHKYRQGIYRLKNPQKYKGDPTNVIFRSSWEKILFIWFDTSDACIQWSSEEIVIPYISPLDGQPHRYFPDVFAKIKTRDGIKDFLVEVKPYAQTLQPTASQGKSKRVLLEQTATFAVNQAKWDAAKKYCEQKGYHFKVFTEYELGIKKRT